MIIDQPLLQDMVDAIAQEVDPETISKHARQLMTMANKDFKAFSET